MRIKPTVITRRAGNVFVHQRQRLGNFWNSKESYAMCSCQLVLRVQTKTNRAPAVTFNCHLHDNSSVLVLSRAWLYWSFTGLNVRGWGDFLLTGQTGRLTCYWGYGEETHVSFCSYCHHIQLWNTPDENFHTKSRTKIKEWRSTSVAIVRSVEIEA